MKDFLLLNPLKIEEREIMIVRDDVFPFPGGGIKARKALYYEKFMLENGYNACVTTGGIQSNHNRAIALICAKNGWKCHIVFHGDRHRFESEKGNALMVRLSDSRSEFVDASQISDAMDTSMKKFEEEGLKPLYIHGGGHDIPGGEALVEAVMRLKNQCRDIDYKPDYIFHASGTGSTQAGIAVGLDLAGWSDVKLIGISVARQKERGTRVIEDFANELAARYGFEKNYRGQIEFNTDYLCGGYEECSPEMEFFLKRVMKQSGIMFDTTYSGKALYGMHDFIKRNNTEGKILFWHTGGIMNLMK